MLEDGGTRSSNWRSGGIQQWGLHGRDTQVPSSLQRVQLWVQTNIYKKLNAWTAIGKKFGMTPSEAEKKYSNICSSYARYLTQREKMPSWTGHADVSEPPEFRNLDWLITFIEHRDTIWNAQHEGWEGSLMDESEESRYINSLNNPDEGSFDDVTSN